MRLIHTVFAIALSAMPLSAQGVDPAKLKAFVEVTGYNVIIDSLQLGAMEGPGMVGDVTATFGKQYRDLAEEVFDPAEMNERALEILEATLPADLVDYGADFYASDLGQRLVAVENEAHMADDQERMAEGNRLVTDMAEHDPERLEIVRDLATAVGSSDVSIRALTEMQVRFTEAAIAAGAMDTSLTGDELRGQVAMAMEALRPQMDILAVLGNAYTYRALPNEDLAEYVRVLHTPEMQQIYDVLNAVQYQIMIERYEVLGTRMGELKPETEL